jgi:hypothetical protein
MDHTSKSKAERSSEPRKKYYINPALSPFYDLPEAHTKEPVYAKLGDILRLAEAAGAVPRPAQIPVTQSPKENPNQLLLFPDVV